MFDFLRHHYNRLNQKLHEYALPVRRSTHWRTVEQAFLRENPSCAACGTKKHIQIHHCKPFHLFPALELDPSNLISLCMSFRRECHLRVAHCGNWKTYNPDVRADAARALAHPEEFATIVKQAAEKAQK